jgi:hypothetical protein
MLYVFVFLIFRPADKCLCHLPRGDPAPVCNHCEAILTVLRLAQACPLYERERKTFREIPGDDRGNASNFMAFLRDVED